MHEQLSTLEFIPAHKLEDVLVRVVMYLVAYSPIKGLVLWAEDKALLERVYQSLRLWLHQHLPYAMVQKQAYKLQWHYLDIGNAFLTTLLRNALGQDTSSVLEQMALWIAWLAQQAPINTNHPVWTHQWERLQLPAIPFPVTLTNKAGQTCRNASTCHKEIFLRHAETFYLEQVIAFISRGNTAEIDLTTGQQYWAGNTAAKTIRALLHFYDHDPAMQRLIQHLLWNPFRGCYVNLAYVQGFLRYKNLATGQMMDDVLFHLAGPDERKWPLPARRLPKLYNDLIQRARFFQQHGYTQLALWVHALATDLKAHVNQASRTPSTAKAEMVGAEISSHSPR